MCIIEPVLLVEKWHRFSVQFVISDSATYRPIHAMHVLQSSQAFEEYMNRSVITDLDAVLFFAFFQQNDKFPSLFLSLKIIN